MKQKLLLLCVITLSFGFSSQAQWSLGDIAFSAYGAETSTNTPAGPIDAFTIVLLKNVLVGEQVSFTENGWFAAGGFRSGENTITLTFTGNYTQGAQITLGINPSTLVDEARDEGGNLAGTLDGNGLNLATGGDQIFVYDPNNMPTAGDQSGFIAAIQMNGAWNPDSTSSTTSAQPSVFTDGLNSISIAPEVDNARVSLANCGNFSDLDTLRMMLNTASNWETDNSTAYDQSSPICDFKQDLSIDDQSLITSIVLTPNPVSNTFKLSGITDAVSIDKIEIYDITGQRVLSIKDYNASTPIDISSMGSGIYLSKIYSGDKTVVKRLIKK